MGEAKRRQDTEKDSNRKGSALFPWIPITESQGLEIFRLANQGAWIGIGIVLVVWITIRFIGPFFGWWEVQS